MLVVVDVQRRRESRRDQRLHQEELAAGRGGGRLDRHVRVREPDRSPSPAASANGRAAGASCTVFIGSVLSFVVPGQCPADEQACRGSIAPPIPTVWGLAAQDPRSLGLLDEPAARLASRAWRVSAYEHAAGRSSSRLADSASDVDELRREAIEVLQSAIGFEHWCSLLLDPDTLVIGQGIGDIDWQAELPRLNLIEREPERRQQSHHARAEPRPRRRPERRDRRRPRALASAGARSSRRTASATSCAASSSTSSAAGASSCSSATAMIGHSTPRTRS